MYKCGKELIDQIRNTNLPNEILPLWYLGQEGVLLKTNDKYIIFDPYFTDYVDKTVDPEKKMWVRNYPSPLDPKNMGFLDIIFITHAHYDHMDPWTLQAIYDGGDALFVAPPCVIIQLAKMEFESSRLVCAYDMRQMELKGLLVTPIGVAHDVEHFDSEGNFEELSYYLKLENGISLYHGGDITVTPSFLKKTADIKIDIALLPINGTSWKRTLSDIIGNIGADEAAELSDYMKADLFIPLHFDLYPVNEENPARLADLMYRKYFGKKYSVMQPGERLLYLK